jgi:hypothetical protein
MAAAIDQLDALAGKGAAQASRGLRVSRVDAG